MLRLILPAAFFNDRCDEETTMILFCMQYDLFHWDIKKKTHTSHDDVDDDDDDAISQQGYNIARSFYVEIYE